MSLIKKFFLIAGSITGIYLVICGAVTFALIAADNKVFQSMVPTPPPSLGDTFDDNPVIADSDQPLFSASPTPAPTPDNEEGAFSTPVRTNFLLVALDRDGVLTDALMAGCFYRDTCEVKLMSIPRDLYTRVPKERLDRMRDEDLHPPRNGVMKINALRSYGGGRSSGNKYLLEQLGDMLGIQFHYYVEVDIPAFKKIVDTLGPIEVEIPDGGLYYDDPDQDLHIAIPEGKQMIDGDTAEGLVRFRRYPTGDLGRNAMQMEFMKQLFRQVLSKEAIMRDPLAVIDVILSDVRTNAGADLVKYIPYVSKFTTDKLTTHTMPGEGAYIGEASYFLPDNEQLAETINEVFYTITQPEPEPAPSASPTIAPAGGAPADEAGEA